MELTKSRAAFKAQTRVSKGHESEKVLGTIPEGFLKEELNEA